MAILYHLQGLWTILFTLFTALFKIKDMNPERSSKNFGRDNYEVLAWI